MLAAHLDPDIDAASRCPETIDRTVKWLIEMLSPESRQLRVGPGMRPRFICIPSRPGRIAGHGHGLSRRSIEYAIQEAMENNLKINYRYENYLNWEIRHSLTAALLIFGDYLSSQPGEALQTFVQYPPCPQA